MKSFTFHFSATAKRFPGVFHSLLTLFLVAITSGCQPAPSLEHISESTPIFLPVITPSFDTKQTPVNNGISPTPSQESVAALTPTETPDPADPRIVPCTNKDQPVALDPSQDLPGTLLFISLSSNVIALNPASLEERTLLSLQETMYAFGGIGLDDRWIALELADYPLTILLLSADGEVIIQDQINLPILTEFEGVGWANRWWIGDHTVLMGFGYRETEIGENKGDNEILDPFRGRWHAELLDSLADQNKREYFSGVAISPDLTRALYIRGKDWPPDLVLWDTGRQMALWNEEWYGGPPFKELAGLAPSAWSHDSTMLAFLFHPKETSSPLIYLVDRNGMEIGNLLIDVDHKRASSVRALTWSPNGRYLAFTMPSEEPLYALSIYIYDHKTEEVTLLCLLDEGDVPLHRLISQGFVWSPDSRYLVYHLGSNFPDVPGVIVMQNIFTGEIWKIDMESEFPFLIGWSSVSPWMAVSEEIDFPPIPGPGE